MFEKVADEKFNNSFFKGYICRQDYNILNLIEDINKTNNEILNIYINEDADIGLKCFEGNYTLDDFLKKYNEINKDDIISIVMTLTDNNQLYFGKNNYINLCSDYDIELEDILNTKSKKI